MVGKPHIKWGNTHGSGTPITTTTKNKRSGKVLKPTGTELEDPMRRGLPHRAPPDERISCTVLKQTLTEAGHKQQPPKRTSQNNTFTRSRVSLIIRGGVFFYLASALLYTHLKANAHYFAYGCRSHVIALTIY